MESIGLVQGKNSTQIVAIGFITMIFLAIFFGFIALDENKKLADFNYKMYQHPFSVSIAVLEASGDILAMRRYMKNVVLASNDEELDTAISHVKQHERKVHLHFEVVKERYLGNKESIDAAYIAFIEWKLIREELIALKRNKQTQQIFNMTVSREAEHLKKLDKNMDFLIEFARSKALEFKDSSERSYSLSKSSLYRLLFFTILLNVITAFFVIFLVRKAEFSRHESEERFKAIFNNAEVSIWSEDFSAVVVELDRLRREGVEDLKQHLYADTKLAWDLAAMVKVNSVNNATLKLFGAKDQLEFLSKIDKTFGDNAIDVFIDEMCAIWDKQDTFLSEANFRTLKGQQINTLISFQIPLSTNNYRNVPVSIVNISEQKRLESKLKLSSRVFSGTHEGIMITDASGVIVDVNPAFSDITGYTCDEVIDRSPNILRSGKHSAEFYAKMWKDVAENDYWQGEIWNRRKSGEVFAELLTISSLKSADGRIVNYLGMFTDITHSKRQQENMRRMAHYDALTGLPNRALLLDRFTQAIAQSKRSGRLLAICFLDLDDFKPVNDTFGHDVGDKLLVEVSRRLVEMLRAEDTVSRLGGDEFSMLLGDLSSTAQCCEILDRVIKVISATYYIDQHPINISASIGVSLSPFDGVELDILLRQSDQAMYQAKQEGKNNYQFFDLEQAQSATQLNVKLQEIKRALLNDELHLYYQPKVNMASGKIIGAEALIRWQHPEKGIIPPLEFLPFIEGSPLENEVGAWVIEQALVQLEMLISEGVNIEVSINVSSLQLLNVSFFDDLSHALERHPRVKAQKFKLEVLESSTLGNVERIRDIIGACRDELGVRVALDDFGTGYSSLSHLRELPADTIKIDQSFVRDVLVDQNDFSIIDGVIGLAKSFNRHVIAEGVESTEHGQMLLLMGCYNAQGYAIAKPMPANRLLDWIREYQPNQIWLDTQQEQMAPHARRIKQLELILNHWFSKIITLLESNVGEPIHLAELSCHFDKWVGRLRDDLAFEEQWINDLEQAYNEVELLAKEIVSAGDNLFKTDNISKLHSVYNKMLWLLSLVEMTDDDSKAS